MQRNIRRMSSGWCPRSDPAHLLHSKPKVSTRRQEEFTQCKTFLEIEVTMQRPFARLVRFKDPHGKVLFGEAPAGDGIVGSKVAVFEGTVPWDLQPTAQVGEIAEVLLPSNSPLELAL